MINQPLHPGIKLSAYLLFAINLVLGASLPLLLFASLLLLMLVHFASIQWRLLLRSLLRLRWLFLSILVLYSWMQPSGLMHDSWAWLAGVLAGLQYCLILALLAVSVVILLETTPLPQLVEAIYWLVMPLSLLGLKRDRLALRLALVIETLADMRQRWQSELKPDLAGLSLIDKIAAYFVHAFRLALRQADASPMREVDLPVRNNPPWWQWIFLLLLLVLFRWIATFSFS
ncbi:MAG: CbiQ family ECF transporter T component [Gammaproteobacteria bacterium]|nr:CbiQ family ECF transporter T component [Gammaproteobacteria bacterium]